MNVVAEISAIISSDAIEYFFKLLVIINNDQQKLGHESHAILLLCLRYELGGIKIRIKYFPYFNVFNNKVMRG